MHRSELHELREKERLEQIRTFVAAASSLLCLPLFLLFWVLDLVYAPEHKWEFLALRLLIIPACLLTLYFNKRCKTVLAAETVAGCYILANSLIITTLIFKLEGASSPYYAGLNLLSFGLVFFPLTRLAMAVFISVIYLPYFLMALYTQGFQFGPLFFVNVFFMASTVIVSLVVRYYMGDLRKKEFEARQNLREEIRDREKTIARKTKEAVHLTQLTKQFSPQVVQLINEDKINLNDMRSTKICAIFIDIVESTTRMNQISVKNFNAAITLFMDDVMKVLLKYDITIDKFMGDGVLAFANAPIPRKDYVNRILNASLEIRQRIQMNMHNYRDSWNDDLRLRMGIASGEAIVGFYGNRDSVKSYTGIGKPINLAARLCSAAKPDQILVEQAAAAAVKKGNYELEEQRIGVLKGFEGETVKAYALLQPADAKVESDVELCPFGHGVLHLDTNDQGVYVFKCRECNYIAGEKETTDLMKKSAA